MCGGVKLLAFSAFFIRPVRFGVSNHFPIRPHNSYRFSNYLALDQMKYRIPPIGHSTGWIAGKISPQISVQAEALRLAGDDAAELVPVSAERIEALRTGSALPAMRYLSFHLGDFREFNSWPASERLNFSNIILDAMLRYKVSGASVHPDLVTPEALAWLKNLEIPIAIENMDRAKTYGKSVNEVISLCNDFALPLVLDLQHTYECALDNPRECRNLAEDFVRAAFNAHGIKHIHLSGEVLDSSGNQVQRHASLLFASNREAVMKSLFVVRELCHGVLPPIILEGDPIPHAPEVTGKLSSKAEQRLLEIAAQNMRAEREWLLNALQSNKPRVKSWLGTETTSSIFPS